MNKKIGYMVSAYPTRSHTFIRREMEGLETEGFTVFRYSQRRYEQSEILNDAEAQEYSRTWSIFPLPLLDMLVSHWQLLLKGPVQFFGALRWSVSNRPSGMFGIAYALMYFFQGIHLAKAMAKDDLHLLHIHFVNSGVYVGACAAKYLDIPWGASVHGRADFDFPGVHALSWVLKEATFLRCISQFGASQAMRQCDSKYWQKIFVCYCGLPDEFVGIEPKSLLDLDQPKVLLSVGRLSVEKGQFLLLKLAEKLKSDQQDFSLVIIGDGPDRAQLKQMAKKLNVEDVCCFIGAVDEAEVLQQMSKSTIFICSSLMEGLPQVLMEAMAVDLPVVAPYLAGIPELVKHNETGLLYSAGDSLELTHCVKKLLNDYSLSVTCAKEAKELLKNKFILSKTLQPLVDRLSMILE